MSKLKQTVEKSLENIYWVSNPGSFKVNGEYPSDFEQKFGNISFGSIIFKEYRADLRKINILHDFLKNHGFDVTQQYNLGEFKNGNYFCDDMMMVVKCSFGLPENKLDKTDEDGYELSLEADGQMIIIFCPLLKNKEKIENFINEFVNLGIMFIPMTEKSFYMIAEGTRGLFKQKTTFKNMEIRDDRYDIYYGDKFPHDKFKKFVTEETENLLLLHGDPGTGKSNYIKNLITEAEEDVIYVPPSMVSIIASPGFVSFMLQNKNNIILIEDAEEILSVDRNSATNNLLGLTDGFLKDALNLKIICTFNCDLKKIDPALLRKGRLFFEYKFDKLSIEEGQRLVDFCDLNFKVEKEMTLAEIFNYHKDVSVENSFEERAIGFGNF